jgi:quinol monooxygenase YgiN
MAYVVVARMITRDGEQDRAAQIIEELVPASREEPGVIQYVAHRDPEDPRVFLMYEQYRDEAAFEEHGKTEHFTRLGPGALFGLMEDRRREFYVTLD